MERPTLIQLNTLLLQVEAVAETAAVVAGVI
jgi:hypothetical protein